MKQPLENLNIEGNNDFVVTDETAHLGIGVVPKAAPDNMKLGPDNED